MSESEVKPQSVQLRGEYVSVLTQLKEALQKKQGRLRLPSKAEAVEYALVFTLNALKGDQ